MFSYSSTEALEAHPEEFPYASPIACAHRIMPLKDEPEIQDEKGIEPERFLKVFSMFSYTMLVPFCISLIGSPVSFF